MLISHNLNDVFAVADNISVLYLGRMAAQVRLQAVTRNQVVELITSGRSGDLGMKAADSLATRPGGHAGALNAEEAS